MCGVEGPTHWHARTVEEFERKMRTMEEWRTEQYLMNKTQRAIAQAQLYNEQQSRMQGIQAALGSPSPYNHSHTAMEQNINSTKTIDSPYQWQSYGGHITIRAEDIANGLWDTSRDEVHIPVVNRHTKTDNTVLEKLRGRMQTWLDSALAHARSCQVSQ